MPDAPRPTNEGAHAPFVRRDNPSGNQTMSKTKTAVATLAAKIATLAIGPKGTAFALSVPEGVELSKPVTLAWTGFKASGVSALDLCNTHARGRAYGGAMACYDAGCYVSERGQAIRLVKLADALKSKLVRWEELDVTRDGVTRRMRCIVPEAWTPATKLPYYLATLDVPAGRLERGLIHESGKRPSRNAALVASVSVPGRETK